VDVGIGEAALEVVFLLAGDADFRLTDGLMAALLRLSARRPTLVILDLSGLRSISSLAMGVLVSFRRDVIRRGGRVRLAKALQEPVREALERAGVLALFGPPEAA
jgi:anti-anti-sigma factor